MQLHRCRFFEWFPASIEAIAYSCDGTYLAVARSSGDVELWNVKNGFYSERKFYGSSDYQIKTLAWVGEPGNERLFIAGFNAKITEINISTMTAILSVDSYGGPIWCIAPNNNQDFLAVGCEDGCIRLFDITDGNLVYQRAFTKQPDRVLSLCWHISGNDIFSGSSDSVIRRWSVINGRTVSRMTAENYKKTHIWDIKVLKDFTVITGDSNGHTSFWDGQTSSLWLSFNSHKGDILCLAVNTEENLVYSTGIEPKVKIFSLVPTENENKWVQTHSVKRHSHDIKAMSLFKNVLVTGGVDTQLIVAYDTQIQNPNLKKFSPFPTHPAISSSPSKFLLSHTSQTLELWKLGYPKNKDNSMFYQPLKLKKDFEKIAEINLETSENIICSDLDPNLMYFACSDSKKMRIFQLLTRTDGSLKIQNLNCPSDLVATNIKFTNNSKIIISTVDYLIHIIDLPNENNPDISLIQTFSQHRGANSELLEGIKLFSGSQISTICTSDDCKWLVTGDLNNSIHIFDLNTLKFHSTLPKLDSFHTNFKIEKTNNYLFITCVDNKFHVFDILNNKFVPWSKSFGFETPNHILYQKDKILGISFNPSKNRQNTVFFWSNSWFCRIKFDLNLDDNLNQSRNLLTKPPKISSKPPKISPKKKFKNDKMIIDSKDNSSSKTEEIKVFKQYGPILYLDFIGEDEIVVVERDWLQIESSFPDPLFVSKFGI